MGHTLEQFAATIHDILAAEPGPAGREKVRALVEDVLTDEAFVAQHLGDDVPERKILFEDPQLGFCILAHVYQGARESKPHDHGPTWAIYGQARGETLMNDWALVEPASAAKPGKVRHVRSYPSEARHGPRLQRGRSPLPAPRRADPPHPHRGPEHGPRSSGWPTTRSETNRRPNPMKDNLRFVDSDMHIMEPPDLFERYLDPKFRDRVILPIGADGRPKRGTIVIDGLPTTMDAELQQYRKRSRGGAASAHSTQPLSGSRLQGTNRLDFAIERNYDPEAQVMGMAIEGVDIAVLYPTTGLSLLARDNMDPQLSLALCQAYNNWIHEFCRYSPERLKFVAMLPVHDVHLACRELHRCVRELGAVGSFIRPNLVNGHYWHSNYWDPLYSLHEELDVTWGFHEGTGAWNSHMNVLYGENRFYRHVASHWIEMQQALIAMIIGGVFEFHPSCASASSKRRTRGCPGSCRGSSGTTRSTATRTRPTSP